MAYAPDLPGCMSDGETDSEALNNLRLAVDEWCDEAKRLNREIPIPGSAAKAAAARRAQAVELLKSQSEAMERQQTVIQELSEEIADLKSRLGDLVCLESNLFLVRSGWADAEGEAEVLPNALLPIAYQAARAARN